MGLSIQQRPNQVNGVAKSIFVAVRNPVLYKIRREDYQFTAINNAGGFVRVDFVGINLTGYFSTGNTVYLKNALTNIYDGVHTITSSTLVGADTQLVLDVPYSVATGAGFLNNLNKRTDWKAEVEVFRASDNTSLTGFKFSYYPDLTGICNAYVHSVLASYLSQDWVNPAGINEVETGTDLRFYVKYNEYYDGAAQAVTNDSANQFVAVNAAMQIYYSENTYGHGNNLLSFVPADSGRGWLTRFRVNSVKQKLRVWSGYPYTLSLILASGLGTPFRRLTAYDGLGNMVAQTLSDLDYTNTDRVHRMRIDGAWPDTTRKLTVELGAPPAQPGGYTTPFNLPDNTFATGVTPGGWTNDSLGSTQWSGSGTVQCSLNTGNTSKILSIVATDALNFKYLKIDLTTGIIMAGKQYRVRFYIDNTVVYVSGPINSTGAAQTITGYVYYAFPIITSNSFGFSIEEISGGVTTYIVDQIDITEGAPTLIAAPLTFEYVTPGDRAILLFWKNSLGGDSFFMFDYNQEFQTTLSNGKKAKRMTLFAQNLDAVEWDAINELNTSSEVYRNNITELSSAVIKSHSQIGQQVYMIDAAGNKIGVTVVPSQPRSETRKYKHTQEVVIELPEAYI